MKRMAHRDGKSGDLISTGAAAVGRWRPQVASALSAAAFLAALATAIPANAQTQPSGSPARPTGTAGASTNGGATKSAAAKPAAKSEGAASPQSGGEGGLRQRVEQLEEQLVEMQVTVGTLDSLAKGGGSSSSGVYRGGGGESSGGNSGDPGRIAALETQVRALATQVDQLTQQIRQMNSRAQGQPAAAASVPVATAPLPHGGAAPQVAAAQDNSDPIGRLVSNGSGAAPGGQGAIGQGAAGQGSVAPATLPQFGASDASSKQAYETAYGYLLQQDFGAAETAFDDFLKRYPNDPLAGNAQYWLGETYFARGQFKPAASAFLKGYQTYARGAKAPDSVLKLAMSLDKLGQRDAACASYAELNTKFPNAPGHVKNRADTERRRLGCS